MTQTLPESVEIRPGEPSDADTVASLWLELVQSQKRYGTHLKADANRHRAQQTLARYAASDQLVVAESIGKENLLGFVMFRVETQQYAVDVARGLIENLYVTEDHRERGIGSALINRAERALDERAVEVIAVEAMAENEHVQQLYRRHGYDPHRVVFEKPTE